MSSEKRFLNAKEIAEITGLSKEGSYKIIRELNDELSRKGFLTVRGKVINSYNKGQYTKMIKKVLGLLYLDTMILQAKRDKQQKEDLKPKEMQKFMKAILYLIKQKI